MNGLESEAARAQETERLLEWGFRTFEALTLYRAGEAVEEAEVRFGRQRSVVLTIEDDLRVTLPRTARNDPEVQVSREESFSAPVLAGDRLGTVVISAPGIAPIERPLIAANSVERLGFFGRIFAHVRYLVRGILS